MGTKHSKQLPSGLSALLEIVSLKFTREQIEKAIEDKAINTFSDAGDIRSLAKKLGLLATNKDKKAAKAKAKAKPKRERIADAFEFLAKLGLTVDDLVEETGGHR